MQCSVLASPASAAVRLKRILVPTDFSAPSRQALHYALRFAQVFGGEVTLLHVIERLGLGSLVMDGNVLYSENDRSVAEKNLRALCTVSKADRFPEMGFTVREGLPAHEIVETAKELATDLIVIATHGHTSWRDFCIGSTAERVVRAAPCPVFVVREHEHDFIR